MLQQKNFNLCCVHITLTGNFAAPIASLGGPVVCVSDHCADAPGSVPCHRQKITFQLFEIYLNKTSTHSYRWRFGLFSSSAISKQRMSAMCCRPAYDDDKSPGEQAKGPTKSNMDAHSSEKHPKIVREGPINMQNSKIQYK